MTTDVRTVLYLPLHRESPRLDTSAWQAAGVSVLVAPTDAIPTGQFDRVVIDGLDAVRAHHLDRALTLAATPIVVACDQRDGLDLSSDDAAAWRRFCADSRVTWLVRSAWHRDAAGLPVERTAVVHRGATPQESTRSPGERLSVLFPRPFSSAPHDALDLFVRTVWLLRHSPSFEQFDFGVSDTPSATWTADLPVRHMSEADVVFLPARTRSDEPQAAHWARRGAALVATATGGVAESVPASALVPAGDPERFATALLALLDPQHLAATQAEHRAWANTRTAAAQAAAELDVVSRLNAPSPRRATAPLLSVVVPAWNAEAHLERCVESLTRADLTGLEVIVVNDGSTDGTARVAAELAARHPAVVRVVSQTNRGHGGAINTGLEHARGEWFRVVDADDWVDSPALGELGRALAHDEWASLVLTDYAEVRPDSPTPKRVPLFGRLPPGVLCTFDGLIHERYGLTSWGPILSTSTFRTSVLRRAGLRLTEHSAYVDLEYCTLGLQHVETFRALDLDLYRYSLGSETQSVSAASYAKRYRQHEAVITRLCEFVSTAGLSTAKRTYIERRVIAPVVQAHLSVLRDGLRDAKEERAFRERMRRFSFVEVPERTAQDRAREALRSALPPSVWSMLAGARRYFD